MQELVEKRTPKRQRKRLYKKIVQNQKNPRQVSKIKHKNKKCLKLTP